jgi:hypothetical protein
MNKRSCVKETVTVPRKKPTIISETLQKHGIEEAGDDNGKENDDKVESLSPLPTPAKTPLPQRKNQKRTENEVSFIDRQIHFLESLQ